MKYPRGDHNPSVITYLVTVLSPSPTCMVPTRCPGPNKVQNENVCDLLLNHPSLERYNFQVIFFFSILCLTPPPFPRVTNTTPSHQIFSENHFLISFPAYLFLLNSRNNPPPPPPSPFSWFSVFISAFFRGVLCIMCKWGTVSSGWGKVQNELIPWLS